jgi:hypothetical protein
MAQFGRPIADKAEAGSWFDWEDNAIGGSNYAYVELDETPYDDADYIYSPVKPISSEYFEVYLGALNDPTSGTGTIRIRAKKTYTGGIAINLTCELRNSDDDSVVATIYVPDASWDGNFQSFSQTFDVTLVNTWGSANDLYVHFNPTISGGGTNRQIFWGWVEVEVPDVAGADSSLVMSQSQRILAAHANFRR